MKNEKAPLVKETLERLEDLSGNLMAVSKYIASLKDKYPNHNNLYIECVSYCETSEYNLVGYRKENEKERVIRLKKARAYQEKLLKLRKLKEAKERKLYEFLKKKYR